ncbi:MAG: PAS domain S-box protein [Planctomycetota bacterium]|nr:PAS domain S-box protein [Planctomycetota bacterium]
MSAGSDKISGSSRIDLDGPLPWRVLVDRKLRITDIGRSFKRICPSMKVGDELKQHLELTRPDRQINSFENIASIAEKLVIVRSLDTDLTLRATFFISPGGDTALLVATPLVTEPGDLWNAGIQLTDFAPHELIADLLFAVQARDTSLLEAREILNREMLVSKNHRAIVDSAFDAMITINLEGRVVSFNNSAIDMFGYSRAEVIGRRISDLIIPPEYREAHEAGLERFRTEGVGQILNQPTEITAQHADEHTFPIELTIIPFENDGSQFFTATIRDLTEVKQQQKDLDEAANQERLLHRELDHRVKNMLATIVALCREAAKHASTDRIILLDLSNRIMGFSRIHELLSREGGKKLELRQLIQTCIDPFVLERGEAVTLSGPTVNVKPSAAVKFVMVFNELATNASKHDGLKHEQGCLKVDWTVVNDQLELSWQEQHAGEVPEELEGGFGTMILRSSIPYEFEGDVLLEPTKDGIIFKARIPIDRIIAY